MQKLIKSILLKINIKNLKIKLRNNNYYKSANCIKVIMYRK